LQTPIKTFMAAILNRGHLSGKNAFSVIAMIDSEGFAQHEGPGE